MADASNKAIVNWGVAPNELSNAQRWMTLACMFFFGLTAIFAMLKSYGLLPLPGQLCRVLRRSFYAF